MRFFTRQWCNGDLSDEEVEATWTAYRAHLDALLPRMPATVRALAYGVNIHDGLFQIVALDRKRRTLTVLMRCGDLQVGYFDLEIVYHEVGLTPAEVDSLRDLARTPRLEALYDEVDAVSVDRWTHRMIFSDYRETTVAFERLGLHLTPTAGREFERQADLFVEVASEAV